MRGDVGTDGGKAGKDWESKREQKSDSLTRGKKKGTRPTQWGAGEKEKERWEGGRRDRT